MSRILAVSAMLWSAPVLSATWLVDHDRSAITFTVTQMNSPVEGSFGEFDAEIEFDPATPQTAMVRAEIEIDSVDTGNSQRDDGIKGRDFLDTANYPKGVFESDNFASMGGNDYEVTGNLTLRGITQQVVLPVTIVVDGDTATANGQLEVNRRDFEIGVANADADKLVGEAVTITLQLGAKAAGQ